MCTGNPDGPDHGLFFRNWMVHLADARARGMTVIETGPTTYIAKQRMHETDTGSAKVHEQELAQLMNEVFEGLT